MATKNEAKYKQVTISVEPNTYDILAKQAEIEERTLTSLIRLILKAKSEEMKHIIELKPKGK